MKPQDDWFTSANILQMIYIAGTFIFSALIWWATRAGAKATKAATQAAEASQRLANELNERAKKLDEDLKEQFRTDLLIQSLMILNSGVKLKTQLTSQELGRLPEEINFSNEHAAKYLNTQEKLLLHKAKVNLNSIRKEIYQNGQLKWSQNPGLEDKVNIMVNALTELVRSINPESMSLG
jgi:hypothetical protein